MELCTLKLEKHCTPYMSVDVTTTEPSPATHEGPDNHLGFACASMKKLEPT